MTEYDASKPPNYPRETTPEPYDASKPPNYWSDTFKRSVLTGAVSPQIVPGAVATQNAAWLVEQQRILDETTAKTFKGRAFEPCGCDHSQFYERRCKELQGHLDAEKARTLALVGERDELQHKVRDLQRQLFGSSATGPVDATEVAARIRELECELKCTRREADANLSFAREALASAMSRGK